MIYYNIILLYYIITLYYIILHYIILYHIISYYIILYYIYLFISPMGIYFPNGRSTLWIHLGRIYRESSSFPTRVGWDGQPRMCSPQRSSFFSTSGREIIAESIGKTTGHSWGDHGEIMGSDFFFWTGWYIGLVFFFPPEKVFNGWWAFPPLNWQWACPTSGQSHSASGAMFRKTLSGWWFGTFFIFPYIWFLRNHQPAIFWCFFPCFLHTCFFQFNHPNKAFTVGQMSQLVKTTWGVPTSA